jgi:5'-3' exonuclease
MGVPSFYRWLTLNKDKFKCKNVIIDEIVDKPEIIDWLMIDGNGSFHMCMKYIIDEFKDNNKNERIKNIDNPRDEIIEQIIKSFHEYVNYVISVLNCKNVFIAIDGVAPIAKITQQRQRRYKYLFDSKMKSDVSELFNTSSTINKNKIHESNIPLRSIELTPGTDLMEIMHLAIKKYVNTYNNKNIKMMYSSYHSVGEGEHKILQYIKKNITQDKTIVIYGLDADLIFLSLSVGKNYNIYIMREQQFFNNKEINLTEIITYNYIDVSKLHILIENMGILVNDFILLCFLVGNDFLPRLISIDIKKNGLDKIIDTFLKTFNNQLNNKIPILVKECYELETNTKIFKINHNAFLYFLRKIQWTEQNIWKFINRKKNNNVDNNKLMNNFISGKTENIDFLDRVQFSSKHEFYSHYIGISSINTNNIDIKNMVNNYMLGIEWCFQYYFNKCVSYTAFSYNYLIAPLIEDIINYYPKEIILKKDKILLKPVEQLLIAIPFDTYKYVIEQSIIDKFKNNLEIGYMMPRNFKIDVNKESVYWKCSVKIPNEYYDFINNVNKLEIKNDKNLIFETIYQNNIYN